MIAYICGDVTFKNPAFLIVEANGIGYQVWISLHTYSQIEKLERVKILTHLYIKEDSHTLYGFAEENERSLFRHLISVSGIGPGTAQILLSSMHHRRTGRCLQKCQRDRPLKPPNASSST